MNYHTIAVPDFMTEVLARRHCAEKAMIRNAFSNVSGEIVTTVQYRQDVC
jgi:hypothetical protein